MPTNDCAFNYGYGVESVNMQQSCFQVILWFMKARLDDFSPANCSLVG